MVEILHLGSLVPATVGVCCTVGDRRSRSAVAWVPAIVMLVAMIDSMVGIGMLAPVLWAGILLGLAVWPAVALRRERSARDAGNAHAGTIATAMGVHRSVSLLLMSALVLLAGTSVPGTVSAAGAHGSHAAGVPILSALWISAAALAVFTLWLVTALARLTPQR